MTDQDLMPFGKHKGEKMANVPADYLLFLHRGGRIFGGIKQYINDNLELLEKEAEKKKKPIEQA